MAIVPHLTVDMVVLHPLVATAVLHLMEATAVVQEAQLALVGVALQVLVTVEVPATVALSAPANINNLMAPLQTLMVTFSCLMEALSSLMELSSCPSAAMMAYLKEATRPTTVRRTRTWVLSPARATLMATQ